ncbi:MAG: PTS sugar transporter subunit IIA [Candidatus Hydrogenedentes bacterium]|nr:PTS sugar transporter subunit IIA [Candidatus Hydrogenedentota bacterium]
MSAFGIDLEAGAVRIYGPGLSKHDALDILVDAVADSGAVMDREAFRRAVRERESVMSTGIGYGVAIPHVRIDPVRRPYIGVGISKDGIDYDTLDNQPVHVVVLFAMPSGSQREYLRLLAQVMTALKVPGFREALTACSTPQEVVDILNAPGTN